MVTKNPAPLLPEDSSEVPVVESKPTLPTHPPLSSPMEASHAGKVAVYIPRELYNSKNLIVGFLFALLFLAVFAGGVAYGASAAGRMSHSWYPMYQQMDPYSQPYGNLPQAPGCQQGGTLMLPFGPSNVAPGDGGVGAPTPGASVEPSVPNQ